MPSENPPAATRSAGCVADARQLGSFGHGAALQQRTDAPLLLAGNHAFALHGGLRYGQQLPATTGNLD